MTTLRAYDLVLFGSTGFTGKIVAAYLAQHYQTEERPLRWALAGRSQAKLEAVRTELAAISKAASSLPLLLGDSSDLASLRSIAAQATVICTTVGPYAKYGSLLVEACVAEGTHYCDLTAEVVWIRKMIDAHHDEAKAKKLRIVHSCGYDSIPSDLGCLMMQEAMMQKHGVWCEEIKFFTGPTKGGASGGTIASILNILEEAKDKEKRRILLNPYALNPKDTPRGLDRGDQRGVRWDEDLKRWTGPFLMAASNTRIVRRTHALLDLKYGQNFRYSEVMAFPQGFRGWWMAQSVSKGLGGFALLAMIPPFRKLMEATVLPAPGEGPSKEVQEKGYFVISLIGKAQGKVLYGLVKGNKDPGYAGTAIMLAETAVCLALQGEELPPVFGHVTPASALGQPLIQRLQKAGMTWEIADEPFAKTKGR